MHPVKLVIPGCYYDSQIYAGLLYLWSEDGAILVFDWNRLVEQISLHTEDYLRFAAHCAFRKGSYLYDYEWQLFIEDSDMRKLMISRFEELSQVPIVFSEAELSKFTLRHYDNPFVFPHADCLFYYNNLYVGSSDGLQVIERSRRTSSSHKSLKLWDGPVLSIAASHKYLTLASGTEGLFDGKLDLENKDKFKVRLRSSQPATSVRWLYPSLYSSSYSGGYLVDFVLSKEHISEDGRKREQTRIFREIIEDDDLFMMDNANSASYSWGSHDKICLATQNQIEVIKFLSHLDEESDLEPLGQVTLTGRQLTEVVSADSAHFGYIIEIEGGLLILNSLLETIWLDGEPVNWRIFPDSKDYVNHLHVIYEDHICVFSFTHDYFVDQDSKKAGISH